MTGRAGELAGRLAVVREGIERACADAGRDPGDVVLVAVSKGWPAGDIAILADQGIVDFGENRAEELLHKAEALRSSGLRWHFVGQLQSKKAAAVGRVAHVVQSVDRERVIRPLGSQGRELEVFIQVSLAELAEGADPGRGGAPPGEVRRLADLVAAEPALRLRGVMTLPPRQVEPRLAFRRIGEISAELQRRHPLAGAVSAGMSGDYAAAIAAGATHVRIGSALFGDRTGVR